MLFFQSEVLTLIRETSSSKQGGGAPRAGVSSGDRGPMLEALFLTSSSSSIEKGKQQDIAPSRLPSSTTNGRGGLQEAPHQESMRLPPEQQQQETPKQKKDAAAFQCTCSKGCTAPPCGSCCAHAHVPLSPLHAAPAGWVVGTIVPLPAGQEGGGRPSGLKTAVEEPKEIGAPTGAPQSTSWHQQVLVMPPGVPVGPWAPAIVASPMAGPPMDVQYAPARGPQGPPQERVAPITEAAAGVESPKLRRRKLSEADRRLPRFRAAKGGASWEIPASRLSRRYEDSSSFCLPEEPVRPRKVADTKSDLLLQGTLRPWTRERPPPPPRATRGRGKRSLSLGPVTS